MTATSFTTFSSGKRTAPGCDSRITVAPFRYFNRKDISEYGKLGSNASVVSEDEICNRSEDVNFKKLNEPLVRRFLGLFPGHIVRAHLSLHICLLFN